MHAARLHHSLKESLNPDGKCLDTSQEVIVFVNLQHSEHLPLMLIVW